MGATQPTKKANTNTRASRRRRRGGGRLFSFVACFGLSSPKKSEKNLFHDPAAVHDHGDGVDESVKDGRNRPKFATSNIPTTESIKEIQIVAATAAAAEASPPHHEVNSKTSVDQEVIKEEKNKNKQEQMMTSKVQEILSNPTKLKHSASLAARPAPPQPRLKREKTTAAAIGEGRIGDEIIVAAGKFDPMVGASMITLTLVVMLIWGKVCAILCSAAWVFFIHCFRQNNESFEHKNVSDHQILDLDSHEYKKRVVLQGFLERI